MTVVLGEPIPYYLELEPLEGDIPSSTPPRVRITIYNIPESSIIEIRRTCEGQTWPVPGATALPVTDTAVFTDWSAPLNRQISYTVVVAGSAAASMNVVLASDTSWLQDPLRPDTALPVYDSGRRLGVLTMANGALSSGTRDAEATQVMVMGDKYPRSLGGQRQAATDIGLPLLSRDDETAEKVEALISAPILLFRPRSRMRPLPALAYLAAQVTEEPLDQHLGGQLCRWNITGNLVAAVNQAAVTGQVTYEDVQALLGSYTYGQVQAMAASTTYLDWLKDPLIFTSLSAPQTLSAPA